MPAFPTSLPRPRTPDPAAAPPLRWGVMGTGWIAERFVRALHAHTRQRVVAVAARDAGRAADFAGRHGASRSYGSYRDLVTDPDVDVAYVATVHTEHLACARLALEAGRHVLVEKPLAVNAAQAGLIADLAAERGVFCMEALWTLFLPRFDVVRQLLDDGVLGEVRSILVDFGEHFTAGHRIMRPELAGGPLLDLGTYPLSLAGWVLGEPRHVLAAGQMHDSGVHGQAAAVLTDAHGNQAVVHTTMLADTPTCAVLAGTAATLTLPGPFYQPGDVLLAAPGGHRWEWHEPRVAHDALHFQAAEVARCVAEGRPESPLRPLRDSVATLRVIDEIRRQIGVVFPGEPGWRQGGNQAPA